MPHLHTFDGAHDVTASMFVVREVDGQWCCLVHLHKKLGVWLQPGGHVEHDENPWQAAAHELREEAGYGLAELDVLQLLPIRATTGTGGALRHPAPLFLKTHGMPPANGRHYHSDVVFCFVAGAEPLSTPGEGESQELRWATPAELLADPECIRDCAEIYRDIVEDVLPRAIRVPATDFSLDTPPEWTAYSGQGQDANAR